MEAMGAAVVGGMVEVDKATETAAVDTAVEVTVAAAAAAMVMTTIAAAVETSAVS